jgi:phosphoglycerate dehydrogenase-like enzyme
MTLHVHLLNLYSTASTDELRARVSGDVCLTEGAEIVEPETVRILVGGFPVAGDLDACPQLQALIVPFAGVPAETQKLAQNYPAVTLHSLHFNVIPTAEMAVALLLAAAKLIVPLDQEMRRLDWRSRYEVTQATMLAGKQALILGYGQIGRRVAMALRGLGMDVVGVRRSLTEPTLEEDVEVFPVAALNEHLSHSDVLIMALPETPETIGMVGAEQLALLRPGAIVVNVGRGPTLDEEALYRALCNRSIRAAGIDVWYQYPKTLEERVGAAPSRFPFQDLPNVVMSPHRAGWLSEAELERMNALATLLNEAAAGRAIPSRVDKGLGY